MKFENLYKLFTKEDPFILHKTLGFTCLIHFIYRYGLLFLYGDMDLNNNTAAMMVGVHALLSSSSFIFRVPARQNPTAPMIYQEFRAHSVLFAWRSVLCYYLTFFGFSIYVRMAACLLISYCADIITSYLKCNTTIRDLSFQKSMTPPEIAEIKAHYSRMQVGATMYMLGNLDTAFSPLYAIQIAAFFMTLVRKNIVKTRALNACYGTALWLNAFCFWSVGPGFYLLWVSAGNVFIHLRFSRNWNKYVAWGITFAIFATLYELHVPAIVNAFLEQHGLMNITGSIAIFAYLLKNLIYFGCIFRPDTPATLAAADAAAVQREKEEAAEEAAAAAEGSVVAETAVSEKDSLQQQHQQDKATEESAQPKIESQDSRDSKQFLEAAEGSALRNRSTKLSS